MRRKLTNKLGTPNGDHTVNWQIGELVSTWWRPNFETVMYPYIPPQVAKPKECRKIFLTQLPPTGILGVPKNLKLLAVPLFELYDNAHRYGPVIASLPQLLARVKFVFCDHNAQPLINEHINAYQISNIQVYNKIQKKKREQMLRQSIKLKTESQSGASGSDGDNQGDINMNGTSQNGQNLSNLNSLENKMEVDETNTDSNAAVINSSVVPSASIINNGTATNTTGLTTATSPTLNPLLFNRAGLALAGNMYAQNLLQRQLQLQQLYAAQAQANLLRIPPPALRAPNARLIVTPTGAANNQLMQLQQLQAQQATLAAAQKQQQQGTSGQQSQSQIAANDGNTNTDNAQSSTAPNTNT